ncbi:DUF2786 domain-containing protein [Rhodococcus sp. SORGH_AS_0301]|uniref:DUF2786 domain-containing protein n=1 Tax=Rhodococcus sp. SORGH_AS_0301 TaxID=3041780 RepID=UPI00278673C1|nr:DUF2786 domain-containing protein [Rhodococcus sp. SORGH_AS_0301]MDQ1180101.1 hypothetical protein [Rhodococcus sp. SORGH_AS_0301]
MNPVPELLQRGADAAVGRTASQRVVDDVADQLVACTDADPLAQGSVTLLSTITALYEEGWQPLDLLHVVRRHCTAEVTGLAAAALLHEAELSDATARAPESWVRQVEAIRALRPDVESPVDASPSLLAARLRLGGASDYIAVSDQWIAVLTLLGRWQSLPRLTRIGALPSQWPSARTARLLPPDTVVGAGMLGRIRGLLAKADSTEFEEEADAFTAKAQELMTKYSVDTLVLAEGRTDVVSRRVHVDNPHADARAQLLHVVATVNRTRVVWDTDHALATVVGAPVDVEQTEMLFTSLSVQAARALARAPRPARRKKAASGFDTAFLWAYAVRLGERLAESDALALEEASRRSGDLLPMLATQTVAVEAEVERLFPATRSVRGPRLDLAGWESGRAAANEADLPADRQR